VPFDAERSGAVSEARLLFQLDAHLTTTITKVASSASHLHLSQHQHRHYPMPRLSYRPIENTLRKTQAQPQITVAKRLTDWKKYLNAGETKRNNTSFGLHESLPPTHSHSPHPEGKSRREPTFRFYESVPPTYIGLQHSARIFPEQSIRAPAPDPLPKPETGAKASKEYEVLTSRQKVRHDKYQKVVAKREKRDGAKQRSFNYPWRFLEYPAAQVKSTWAPTFEVDTREVYVKAPGVLKSEKRTEKDQSDTAAQRTGKDIGWLRAEGQLPLPTEKKRRLFSLRPDKVPIKRKENLSLEQTIETLRQDLLHAEQREPRTRGASATQTRNFSHSANTANMSDDAYAKFLEGANDTGATAQETKSYKTKSVNTNVPKALESVEEYYTSDADEPFEPVSLEYEGRDVDAGKPYSLSLIIVFGS
jgi:hypothetical protein